MNTETKTATLTTESYLQNYKKNDLVRTHTPSKTISNPKLITLTTKLDKSSISEPF